MVDTSETDHAWFVRPARNLLEIRLKQGARITAEFIAGIMRERMRLCGSEPLCVLVLVPTDAEFDIAVMGMDHYKENGSSEGVQAVAIVTGTLMLGTMMRLYAAYFPPMFRLEVFSQEMEARAWVDEQLAQIRQAGQKA